jgi:hypothetical protein
MAIILERDKRSFIGSELTATHNPVLAATGSSEHYTRITTARTFLFATLERIGSIVASTTFVVLVVPEVGVVADAAILKNDLTVTQPDLQPFWVNQSQRLI